MIGDDTIIPESAGTTCEQLRDYVSFLDLKPDEESCLIYQSAEGVCCPRNEAGLLNVDAALDAATGPCDFCPNGVAEDRVDAVVPEVENDETCGDLFEYTQTLLSSDIVCQQILLADSICCVP